MISVIFRYYNEQGDEMVSIGSVDFFHQKMETAKQLIERLAREHDEKLWQKLKAMSQSELYQVLVDTLNGDVLHTIHPN